MKNTLLFFWEIIKVVLLALIIVLPIRYFVFQPFIVRGISMEPNFQNGDYLIIDELTYRFRAPQRGEVVVFQYPKEPSEKFIKRIIGLPEEHIELRGTQIIINEEIVLDETEYLASSISFNNRKFDLKENEYLVLGDNREHSFDSRSWGTLPENLIIGRAILRAFPFNTVACISAPGY